MMRKSLGFSHKLFEFCESDVIHNCWEYPIDFGLIMKLNDFCAHLVPVLGISMGELNELTRALREGSDHFKQQAEKTTSAFDPDLLKGRPGPGGGVGADPFRVAFMLLAIAVDAPRKDVTQKTWSAYHLSKEGSELAGWGDFKPHFARCEVTNEHLFGAAIKKIVGSPDLASRVDSVWVQSDLRAAIVYDKAAGGAGKKSLFADEGNVRASPMYKKTVIDGSVFQFVARLLKTGE